MTNLDATSGIRKLDPSAVLDSTAMFADQCLQAWNESSNIAFPDAYKNIYNIVVCGMGGSRFTPRTIKELFYDSIKEPYDIVEDYSLPSYVDADTLVILSSYSGTTEEVIACAKDAMSRGARISAVSQGGDIASIVRSCGATAYIFDPKYNPSGQPRIGSGYMLMGHLGLLYALGLISVDPQAVIDAISFVKKQAARYTADIPTQRNPAKQLAALLKDTHPFIITAEFLKGFGNAFANQINETAKMISDPRVISELNHHLMEGLARPDTLRQTGFFVFVESDLYTDVIKKRFSVTKTVVEKQNIRVHTMTLSGKTKLAQVLNAYTLSGFTTFYMSMLYNTDPAAIPWVDFFKKQMAADRT